MLPIIRHQKRGEQMTFAEITAKADALRKRVGYSDLSRAVNGQIGSAEQNAIDTLRGRADTAEMERVCLATLESNLCYESDAKVAAWFRKAGVRF